MATETARPRPLATAGFLLGTVVTFVTFGLVLWVAIAGLVLGLRPVVVTSGSMAPTIRAGDVVLYEPTAGDASLAPGTVVTFRDPTRGNRLVTHRVVRNEPDGLVTRGDANPSDDGAPVPPSHLVGRGRLLVPYLGLPVVWLRDGAWLAAAAWLLGTAAAAAGALRPPAPSRPTSPAPSGDAAPGRRRPAWRGAIAPVLVLLAAATGAPASAAALTATTTDADNTFATGAWSVVPHHLLADGTTSTVAPTGTDTRLRLDAGATTAWALVATTRPVPLPATTTVEVAVARQGPPAPRTLRASLAFDDGSGGQAVRATDVTIAPGNAHAPVAFVLDTAGLTVPAGVTATLTIANLETTANLRVELCFGGGTCPGSIALPTIYG